MRPLAKRDDTCIMPHGVTVTCNILYRPSGSTFVPYKYLLPKLTNPSFCLWYNCMNGQEQLCTLF